MNGYYKKTLFKILNILYWMLMGSAALVILYLATMVFVVSRFKIPSDSMEPALLKGDYLLVEKLSMGARLFDIKAAFAKEKLEIHRTPALGKVERNDILVFNYPFPTQKDSIELDMMLYYVKRCIALPGDTLEIHNSHFCINGTEKAGNIEAQNRLERLFRENRLNEYGIVTRSFPRNKEMGWSIREMGPFYLPRRGDCIKMDHMTYALYYPLIEWETGMDVRCINDSIITIGNKSLEEYRFQSNYYFVSGDRMENSKDSRYWGLLPEEFIVGRVWMIWKSIDEWGKMRWERIGKVRSDN